MGSLDVCTFIPIKLITAAASSKANSLIFNVQKLAPEEGLEPVLLRRIVLRFTIKLLCHLQP
jgi:hypothetical protein